MNIQFFWNWVTVIWLLLKILMTFKFSVFVDTISWNLSSPELLCKCCVLCHRMLSQNTCSNVFALFHIVRWSLWISLNCLLMQLAYDIIIEWSAFYRSLNLRQNPCLVACVCIQHFAVCCQRFVWTDISVITLELCLKSKAVRYGMLLQTVPIHSFESFHLNFWYWTIFDRLDLMNPWLILLLLLSLYCIRLYLPGMHNPQTGSGPSMCSVWPLE